MPTWRCNLRCSYCDYRTVKKEGGYELKAFDQVWHFGEEISWPAWLVYLNRFRPYHLELTGGEPTMYKHLPDLLAHVPCDSSWAITSNTLNDVRLFEPGNCKFWTASYHYHSREKFLANIDWLKRRGFPLRVTLVMTPENAEHMFGVMRDFRKQEVMVNVHPVLKQGFSWKEHEELIAKMRTLHDGVWVNFVEDVPKEWKPRRYSNCNAGGKYFALMPDGTVLRCYSALLWHGSLGHVSDFEPSSLFRPCGKQCVFHCDNRAKKVA
ncbi:MAG: radical SAM protein [Deltaproteobacteria bacterium]|nr:radical SAM protein [Deltaproteobacteria bacterium]